MAKRRDTDITEVRGNAAMVPKYMQKKEIVGVSEVSAYITPPRIKVVQRQADAELLETFSDGDVILTPSNTLILEMPRGPKGKIKRSGDEGFFITVLFFFPEFLTWNPISLKGKAPAIRGRSMDPGGEIARKARNADTRTEDIDGVEVRHVEHLNFVVLVHDHPDLKDPVLLTFDRGNWVGGKNFCNLIAARHAAIFAGNYKVILEQRSNDMGTWWVMTVVNPPAEEKEPWVSQEDYDNLAALHHQYSEFHKSAKLRVEYSQTAPEEVAVPAHETDDEM